MNINNFQDDLQAVRNAFDKWAAVVISTMGGAGRNIIINTPEGTRITQDGITVLRLLDPKDPLEKIAVRMLVDASDKVVREVGDGTTLTALLTTRLFAAVSELNLPYSELAPALDHACDYVCGRMYDLAQKISRGDALKLRHVASIACHGNTELGIPIANLCAQVGPDGIIFVQQSPSSQTYTEFNDGYVVDSGLISPHFVNTRDGSCSLLNPLFFLANEKIESQEEMVKILSLAQNEKRPLVFIVSEMDGAALATVLANLPNGNPQGARIPMAVIRAPGNGAQRTAFLEDIQKLTNTPTVYARVYGKTMMDFGKDFENGEFGSAVKFVATGSKAVIYIKDRPEKHIEDLRKAMEAENDVVQKNFLRERIAKLSAGIGIIYTGGDSDTEHQWVYDMADDAQRACMAALRSGIVAGAGKALLTAGKDAELIEGAKGNAAFAAMIKITQDPMRVIYENGGFPFDPEAEIDDLFVVDVTTGKRVDPFKAGIIDPLEVPTAALKKAVSVVKQAIKTAYYLS